MMKMKNVLFPLLIMMGVGSAPTMWALSGTERARIGQEINQALATGNFQSADNLIGRLRAGGEEQEALAYEARSVVAYVNRLLPATKLTDLAAYFTIVSNDAANIVADEPAAARSQEMAAALTSVAARQAQTPMEARKRLQVYTDALTLAGLITQAKLRAQSNLPGVGDVALGIDISEGNDAAWQGGLNASAVRALRGVRAWIRSVK